MKENKDSASKVADFIDKLIWGSVWDRINLVQL